MNKLRAKKIDFARSSCTWLTTEEESYGRFVLESSCSIRDLLTETFQTYYLAAGVIAGNVYEEKDLVSYPTYLFQIAMSHERHKIFRSFLNYDPLQDSFARNSDLFKRVELDIVRQEATLLSDFESILYHFERHEQFSAHLACNPIKDYQVDIEFPIKHLNIHPKFKKFQVETGPVLFPIQTQNNGISDPSGMEFQTGFLHFNRFDQAVMTLNSPTPIGGCMTRFYSKVFEVSVQIQLMVDAQ